VAILMAFTGTNNEVQLPSEYKGYPVASIGRRAFANCTNITAVDLNENVKFIGSEAFLDCHCLKEIRIHQNCDSISTRVFANCWSLEKITIPSGVISLDDGLFENCTNLTQVYFLGDCPQFVSSSVFAGDKKVKIYHPAAGDNWEQSLAGVPVLLCGNSSSGNVAENTTSRNYQLSIYLDELKRQKAEMERPVMANFIGNSEDLQNDLKSLNQVLAVADLADTDLQIIKLESIARTQQQFGRSIACKMLGLIGDDRCVGILMDLMQNDMSASKYAAQALMQMGNAGAKGMIQILISGNYDLAIQAADGLGKLPATPNRPDELILSGLSETIKSKDTKVSSAAARALANYPSPRGVKMLMLALVDTNIQADMASIAIGVIGNGRLSIPPIIDLLGNCHTKNDLDLGSWCCAMLGDLGDPIANDVLYKSAVETWSLPEEQPSSRDDSPMNPEDGNEDFFDTWQWRHNSACAKLEMDEEYNGPIHNGQMTTDPCSQACYALARIGKTSLPYLLNLTTNETAWVRGRAMEGLILLNSKNSINQADVILAVAARLKDGDPYVQKLARQALKDVSNTYVVSSAYTEAFDLSILQQDYKDAYPLAVAYDLFLKANINQLFNFGTELQKLNYLESLNGEHSPMSMFQNLPDKRFLAKAILQYKGIVLDSLLADMRAGKTDAPDAQIEIHTQQGFKTELESVQAMLDDNTVLVEYLYTERGMGEKRVAQYGAMLIGNTNMTFVGQKRGMPVWVVLGDSTNLDAAITEFTTEMRGKSQSDTALTNLYALVFRPIKDRLPTGVLRLIISPDAQLSFVNLAGLVDGKGCFVGEKYNVEYVASGRDLLTKVDSVASRNSICVFSAPDFNDKPAPVPIESSSLASAAISTENMRDFEGITFPDLPGTEKEAVFLREIGNVNGCKVSLYNGKEASKARVKTVLSPAILHFATHGFFLPERPVTGTNAASLDGFKRAVQFHNPMQRSGLALAGATRTLDAWKRGEIPDPANDGILTAQEVATLDLHNTWLVTLSACDSGIGEAAAGEGVMGLRRGFVQAGTQNLLMALWPVSDRRTVEFMEAFYQKAMKSGDAPGALADVQRDMLVKIRAEKGALAAARYAGPFIMTFQGRPSSN